MGDHYVAQDFLHVLQQMQEERQARFPAVDILSLGTYLRKTAAKTLKTSGKQFCQFDDYNWDWSLQQISQHCLKEKLQVMMMKGPRVFHIGECGVHHTKKDCDSSAGIEKVKSIIKSAKNYLFPSSLSVSRATVRKKLKEKKPNGGWGDLRDWKLCSNLTLQPPS